MISFNGQPIIILSTLPQKLKGLLNTKLAQNGEYVLLVNCHSVHTFGMKGPIRVYFVDNTGAVIRQIDCLLPNRFAKCREAKHTIEQRI